MNILLYLIPIALTLGLIGLLAFLWTLKNNQYEDLKGASERILIEEKKEKNIGLVILKKMKMKFFQRYGLQ